MISSFNKISLDELTGLNNRREFIIMGTNLPEDTKERLHEEIRSTTEQFNDKGKKKQALFTGEGTKEIIMNSVELHAYGKINLGLDVTGRREDGYHTVKMIMQTVGIFDRISMTATMSPDIVIKSNVKFLPLNENNLIYKAIDLIRRDFAISRGVYVSLEKKLPVSAGMAGGSSDAAAALKGMNVLFGLGLDKTQLCDYGIRIGADVPYCIMGGTALAEGIGELLTPIGDMPDCSILIVKPPINVSTPYIYKKYDELGEHVHPDIDGIRAAIEEHSIEKMCPLLGNVLEYVTAAEHPEISEIEDEMMQLGAVKAMMSGSGPSVFGIFTDPKLAATAFYRFKGGRYGRNTYLTGPRQNDK